MRLETDRLIIRSWNDEDLDDLIEGLNNFTFSRWLSLVPFPYTESSARQWLNYCRINDGENNRNGYEFCIQLKSNEKVIGGLSVSMINHHNGTCCGGIWISEKFQGNGYGAEAFAEKIRFSFEELGMRRLENGFFAGNEASKILQEKFGYKIEGTRRKKYFCVADGEYKDELITGLLKEDWVRF